MSTTTSTPDVVDTTNMVISTTCEEPLLFVQHVLNILCGVLGYPVIYPTTCIEMRDPNLLLLSSPMEKEDGRA
jgi:hypothetical protein